MSFFFSWFIPACVLLCVVTCLLIVRRNPSRKILSRLVGFLLLATAFSSAFITEFGEWEIVRPRRIVVILDRSASMGAKPEGKGSLLEEAIAQIKLNIGNNPHAEWFILDSATKSELTVDSLDELESTDTAANLPELILSASKILGGRNATDAEIWIFSDMQGSNWATNRMGFHPQETEQMIIPRIRVISLRERPLSNVSVRMDSSAIINEKLVLSFSISHEGMPHDSLLPLSIQTGGETVREIIPLPLEKTARLERTISLPTGTGTSSGFGTISLPDDNFSPDNTVYFSFASQPQPSVTIACQSRQIAETLTNMTSPPGIKAIKTSSYRIGSTAPLKLDDQSLLIWQGIPPNIKQREDINEFMKKGGYVLFLPDRNQTKPLSLWNGIKWLSPDIKSSAPPFEISSFVENRGILKNGKDFIPLPLHHVQSIRKIQCAGEGLRSLARWDDGTDAILSTPVGKGGMIICTTLPIYSWSNLADGSILVPLIQRLAGMGTRIQTGMFSFPVGSTKLRTLANVSMSCLLPSGHHSQSPFLHAGVFQNEDSIFCTNRPVREDDARQITSGHLASLLPNANISEYSSASLKEPHPFFMTPWWYWGIMAFLLLVISELPFMGKKR